jgi:hypothetical protein
VARFTRGDGTEPPNDFTISINYGDGSVGTGIVTKSGTTYTVLTSHIFRDEGPFNVAVTISNATTSASVTSSATIAEELLPDGTTGTANQRFVSELYRDLLSRKVDSFGLGFWTAFLDANDPRESVVLGIESSTEYRTDVITQLYQTYLGRTPEPMGLTFWLDVLQGGGTIEDVAAGIAGSPEFFQRSGNTVDGFLNGLYEAALGRPVDPVGKAYGEGLLMSGGTPTQMAAFVLASPEYQGNLVQGWYQSFLHRSLDPLGQAVWPVELSQGVRDEVVLAMILTISNEYFDKTA